MENGVGIADTSHLVEKVLENEVLESRLKGSAEVGSHESKDSEGDEVFEEAVASEISVVYSDNVVVGRDDDVDKARNLDVSVASNEKADGGNDVEEFEEAIGVPVSLDNLKEPSVSIEDERGVFVGAESVHDTTAVEVGNEGSAMEKDGRDEWDGEENDVSISKEEDEVMEVSDITAADEKRSLKDDEVMEVDITEADQKSRAAVDKHENGASNNVGLEGTLAHGISENGHAEEEVMLVDKESKAGDGQLVQRGDSGSLQVAVSADYCDQAEKEQKEVLGLPGTGHQVDRSSENEVYIASGFHVDRVDGAKHDLVSLGAKHEDDKKEDLKRENSESPNEDQKVRSQELKYELGTAVSDHRLTNGKPEVSVEEGDVTSEVEKLPGYEGLVVESDAKTQESPLNYELGTAESDHHLTNGKPEASVVEGDVTSEGKELPGYEDLVVECGAKTQESASDIEMERVEVSKLQPIDKLVERPNAVVEKHGIEGATNEEVKQNTREHSGLREIKPTADPSASSGISENSTPPPARPAGLGRAAPLLESAPRVVQQPRVNGTSSQMQNQIVEDSGNGETEENDETREKLQMIRVKFLRLAHRLGQTPHNVVVAQVLYRLGLAEQLRGRNGGRVGAFSFDRASAMAEQLEAAGQEPLDFSCTIMVLGKTGVGKSATINSIFDEVKFGTDAFHMGTKKVQDVVGTVQGIKVRIIDTPGLLPSWSDQRQNEKILLSVKRFIKKTPPDIVLYLDRLDMQSRDLGDMPLLRTITDIFGPSIWFNAIVVLTHAASAPPEGPSGSATSYDLFVTQRSHVVQQAIRQAAGDMRLMNPVSLVENHSACRKNRAGQRVLPNGQVWKPHLLLLSFASKILAEANTLLKLQDSPPGKPFTTRTRAPPLPFLLSSLLQSRPQLKLPEEQFGDDDILDDDLDESSDSDDESEYDELPPFKRLTKAQLGKLTKDQKKAYFAELEYREKLFMKKQLKEEKRRRKMMKKMAASANELPSDYTDNAEEDSGGAASVPVPMPDLALPASFDSDNPTHRYRYLDSPNQWVVRPVLDTHGWDHDIGYEGVNVERLFVVKQQVPVSFSGQITKDKKDANLQMELASSLKHGEGKATSLGLDMQTLGKDIAYTLRSETKFSNYKKNKATAGLSVTMLGDTFTAGVKIEDKLIVNKRLRVVASGGAMTGRGDVAYGGSFEATLRDKDHPLGRSLSTLGLSVMDWHGDLAIGGNLQSQIPVGRSTNLIARANLNNRGSGQVSIRLNSSEQLQIVLVGLIPLLRKVLGYPQESQFGQ